MLASNRGLISQPTDRISKTYPLHLIEKEYYHIELNFNTSALIETRRGNILFV